jgi:hypothetical protein
MYCLYSFILILYTAQATFHTHLRHRCYAKNAKDHEKAQQVCLTGLVINIAMVGGDCLHVYLLSDILIKRELCLKPW